MSADASISADGVNRRPDSVTHPANTAARAVTVHNKEKPFMTDTLSAQKLAAWKSQLEPALTQERERLRNMPAWRGLLTQALRRAAIVIMKMTHAIER